MVVVFAGFFGMSAACVLYFPGSGVAAAGIKGIEDRYAGQHYAYLAAHAIRVSILGACVQRVRQVLRLNAIRVAVVGIGGVGRKNRKNAGCMARQVIGSDRARGAVSCVCEAALPCNSTSNMNLFIDIIFGVIGGEPWTARIGAPAATGKVLRVCAAGVDIAFFCRACRIFAVADGQNAVIVCIAVIFAGIELEPRQAGRSVRRFRSCLRLSGGILRNVFISTLSAEQPEARGDDGQDDNKQCYYQQYDSGRFA